MPPTRYYQVLNALIDRDEALAHDPMLVKRLQRQRGAPAGQLPLPPGKAVEQRYRVPGTGDLPRCEHCARVS